MGLINQQLALLMALFWSQGQWWPRWREHW